MFLRQEGSMSTCTNTELGILDMLCMEKSE